MKNSLLAPYLIAVSVLTTESATGTTPDLAEAEQLLRRGDYQQVAVALHNLPLLTAASHQRALILEAEAALAMGHPQQADKLFEQAASQLQDSPEAEVGQIRAYFQAGDVRHAIAFGNIVAGEHPDFMEAQALLAWYEDRVGHTEHALAKLHESLAKQPEDIALLAALAEILIDRGMAAEAIKTMDAWINRNPPSGSIYRLRAKAALAIGDSQGTLEWRARSVQAYQSAGEMAQANALLGWLDSADPAGKANRKTVSLASQAKPDAHSTPFASNSVWHPPYLETIPVPEGGAVATGNGFIVDQGRRVVTHARVVVKTNAEVQVRNGMGQVRNARIERRYAKEGVAVLKLIKPYPASWSLAFDRMVAPEGTRFCFTLGYPVADLLDAAYPSIAPGVVFRADVGTAGLMQITNGLSRDQSGSPIFDPSGRLIGIAVGKEDKIEGVGDRQAFLGKGDFAIRADILLRLLAHRETPATKKLPTPALPASLSVEELYDRLRPAVVLVAAPIDRVEHAPLR